jgi:hypothetical protein
VHSPQTSLRAGPARGLRLPTLPCTEAHFLRLHRRLRRRSCCLHACRMWWRWWKGGNPVGVVGRGMVQRLGCLRESIVPCGLALCSAREAHRDASSNALRARVSASLSGSSTMPALVLSHSRGVGTAGERHIGQKWAIRARRACSTRSHGPHSLVGHARRAPRRRKKRAARASDEGVSCVYTAVLKRSVAESQRGNPY